MACWRAEYESASPLHVHHEQPPMI
jgi:hypothetical protein